LSTAHAKARLSKRVEQKDADIAEQILRFALFKEVVEDDRRKRRRTARDPDAMSTDGESSGDDDNEDGDEQEAVQSRRTGGPSTRSQRTGTTRTPAADEEEEQDSDHDDLYNVTPKTQRSTQPRTGRTQSSRAGASSSQVSAASSHPESQLPPTQTESQDSQDITPARLQVFQTALGQLIDGPLFANDAADVEPLVAAVNARLGSGAGREAFSDDEAEKALEALSERNKIMYSGGIVYKI
jgi:DNA replication licensing factor MCM3